MRNRPGWAVVLLAALLSSALTAVVMTATLVDDDVPAETAPAGIDVVMKSRVASLERENERLRTQRARARVAPRRERVSGDDVSVANEQRDAAAAANAQDAVARLPGQPAQSGWIRGTAFSGPPNALLGEDGALDPAKVRDVVLEVDTGARLRAQAIALLLGTDRTAAYALVDEALWSGALSTDAKAAVIGAVVQAAGAGVDLPSSVRGMATTPSTDWALRRGALSALVIASPDEARPYAEQLVDSRVDSDIVRAVEVLAVARDRSYLPLLTRTVNEPAARSQAVQLVNTIASLKDKSWSAVQLTGEPDLPIAGDLGTAWASKTPEMGEVWIELTYARAVSPTQVRVHETLSPGALARVDVRRPGGDWETVWSGQATVHPAPRWFEPVLDRSDFETREVRLIVDTDRVQGWNEIDSVELIGADGTRQWVESARASSSYSD